MSARTYNAVKKQLLGFSVARYETGVKQADGQMIIREYSSEEVLKSVSWFSKANINGAAIYIRPMFPHGFVFIDDITKGAVARLDRDGLEPSVIVETSPGNYQAWIKFDYSFDRDLLTCLCRVIAQEYGGDPNSADYRHFGRVAGYTNRKQKHVQSNGFYPFVLLHRYKGQFATEQRKWVSLAQDFAMEIASKKGNEFKPGAQAKALEFDVVTSEPCAVYKRLFERLRVQYGDQFDASKADWFVGNYMMLDGYTRDVIEDAMVKSSPDIHIRKVGRVDHYVSLTLDNIFSKGVSNGAQS